MRLYAEYLRLWILEETRPPASVLRICEEAFAGACINASELRELLELGDADRIVNAASLGSDS